MGKASFSRRFSGFRARGTFGEAIRCGWTPRFWKELVSGIRARRLVRAAGLVDEDWYRREYPEVAERGLDPVRDFLEPGHADRRMPNPDFVPAEYAAVNFDVKASGIPWAVHYAKDGMREGRAVSALERREPAFPAGTEEMRREFAPSPTVHRRTAVFASHFVDGRIPETVLHYLRGLKEVADHIVFVADNPVFPDEARKLEGLARVAVFRRHGGYDFGSYREGWSEAKAMGLLDPGVCDELVVCNDSCFGPVFPLEEAFGEMARRRREARGGGRFDFWGMTAHVLFGRPHVQSYFYVFGKAVLEEGALERFFGRMELHRERGRIVYFCETKLSVDLVAVGHRFDTLVPRSFSRKHGAPPIKFPATMLSKYRMPLVKAKTLNGESKERLGKAMRLIRKSNPGLAALLPVPSAATPSGMKRPGMEPSAVRAAREKHTETLAATLERLREAVAEGRAIRALFLTTAAEPFLGGALLSRLRGDAAFRPAAAVVPDWGREGVAEMFGAMRDARARLTVQFGEACVLRAGTDAAGEWEDLAEGMDIVCWETAGDASDFHYNPHYAVGRGFLPVLLFDRRSAGPYPPEKEFARQNYAYFWKIFFDDPEDFRCYAAHSIRRGENAVLLESGAWGEGGLRVLKEELGGRESGAKGH